MPEFSIRLAREKDLPALSRFAAPIMASLKFYNEESTKKNIKEISQKELKGSLKWNRNNVIMAVANDGKIIGLGMHYLSSGHVDWLEWLLIDKNFRRKGLGRALVNYAIRNAKMRGGHKVWCDSNPRNKPAVKFFTGMGFRKVGILKKHDFCQDEILWEKQI